ncbi:MAG: threonine ammonia-lyase [Deltaproteobacteria bacterium RBG_13_49_15]|nr:MAG: threonine ammonia-lyase [Deltaproteobacteria bacterium RBG_13_49_15]
METHSSIDTTLPIPGLSDVFDARRIIHKYLSVTPLYRYPGLDALIGTTVYVKHENYQPVGAFKIRGGLNLISRLTPDEKQMGVICASTGNHGQSVAYASRLFGVVSRIVVPKNANPGKVIAMQGMGSQVIFHGTDFDEARGFCEELALREGYRYIHSGDEPLLIAGVATETLEMIESQPRLDAILVPVGGGSGAAGACITAKAIRPSIRIIGVQSEAAPAAYETWRQGMRIEIPSKTIAEGLATGTPFSLPQVIMRRMMDDFILVSEDEIKQAVLWMIERAHTLSEPAGAAPLAGAFKIKESIRGLNVGLVCSGGNISIEQLKMIIDRGIGTTSNG